MSSDSQEEDIDGPPSAVNSPRSPRSGGRSPVSSHTGRSGGRNLESSRSGTGATHRVDGRCFFVEDTEDKFTTFFGSTKIDQTHSQKTSEVFLLVLLLGSSLSGVIGCCPSSDGRPPNILG